MYYAGMFPPWQALAAFLLSWRPRTRGGRSNDAVGSGVPMHAGANASRKTIEDPPSAGKPRAGPTRVIEEAPYGQMIRMSLPR
jgi:hypothetical protein